MRSNELHLARDASSMLPMGPDTDALDTSLQGLRAHRAQAEGRNECRDLEALKESLRAEEATARALLWRSARVPSSKRLSILAVGSMCPAGLTASAVSRSVSEAEVKGMAEAMAEQACHTPA